MHRNISFLQDYFGTINKLTPIEILDEEGRNKYGEAYEQTLFEGILTDLFDKFKDSVLEIVDRIKELVTQKESEYWWRERNYIFHYFYNLDRDSLFDF